MREEPFLSEENRRDCPIDVSLSAYDETERNGAADLFRENYNALKHIAGIRRRSQAAGQTLRTTDLLHEVYIKLSRRDHFKDEKHFFCSAALAMRHVLTDYARSKLSVKRGSGQANVSLEDTAGFIDEVGSDPTEIIMVNSLLKNLQEHNPRFVRVVDCLYFSGYTVKETANALQVSSKTVQRDWAKARVFMQEQMA
ncbi:MAG: ECF-type sigma factor [Pseudomonadota bacterium]